MTDPLDLLDPLDLVGHNDLTDVTEENGSKGKKYKERYGYNFPLQVDLSDFSRGCNTILGCVLQIPGRIKHPLNNHHRHNFLPDPTSG